MLWIGVQWYCLRYGADGQGNFLILTLNGDAETFLAAAQNLTDQEHRIECALHDQRGQRHSIAVLLHDLHAHAIQGLR